MLQATDYEGLAWRKAIKTYLDTNMSFVMDGASQKCSIFVAPSDGQASSQYPYIFFADTVGNIEEHNTKGTLIEDSIFSAGNEKYALRKDGTYTEQTSLVIVASNRQEASSVILGLSQVMNPDPKRHGLYLDLGSMYWNRIARIETVSMGIVNDPKYTSTGLISAVWNIIVDIDSVVLVSMANRKTVYKVDLEVE